MKVIAVIPAYNAADCIANTINALHPYVDGVVVVDDGSSDGTSLKAAGDALVLRHRVNRGQGAALRTGTEAALSRGAEIIVHIDADGQHDPSFLSALLDPLRRREADVVFGSRFLGQEPDGMPFMRRRLLFAARTFNALVAGIPRSVTDPQSGMRAMTAAAARQIAFRQDRMAHCTEILRLVTRSRLRWKEVPVRVRYTAESLSKGQTSMDALNIAWQFFLGVFAE